jgi:prevent-host-death family protein
VAISKSNNIEMIKKLGKAEVRQEFAPLVDSVANGGNPVEISDYGKVVAVLISANEYRWLLSQTKKMSKPKKDLCGAIIIHDDLEMLSKKVNADFEKSISKTASKL